MVLRSIGSGNGTLSNRSPSVDRSTTPPRPMSQQTDEEGDAPPVNWSVRSTSSGCQEAPPSVERSTPPRATIRQVVGVTGGGGEAAAALRPPLPPPRPAPLWTDTDSVTCRTDVASAETMTIGRANISSG